MMTNEQTAVMLELYLEYIEAIKEQVDKIPWVLGGNEVEGVEKLNHVVKNVESKISTQIATLNGDAKPLFVGM